MRNVDCGLRNETTGLADRAQGDPFRIYEDRFFSCPAIPENAFPAG